ncbi:sin3 histone deacetylase corepressor complex component SDS3 isoform X2 [Cricetulus griseus]|uniref:Sin3 histone deacetylase corepressor complex component SDS3 isoform X2 n=1 Tax=Cricetulus griseus TaxID=10029 RepID=A0A9J7JPI1_CRIGR|nr:sin3 histone deacetylase corepressor complex component SDS3 isoform X2 [Cricetulus griseus]
MPDFSDTSLRPSPVAGRSSILKTTMKEALLCERTWSPASHPSPRGWRDQAVSGQPPTRKWPSARGPRCPARAPGAELGTKGHRAARATSEELESAEDDERSCRGRESDEDTEDASETDLAKHDEEDYVEMKEQMYQDKLASLKRQLQQLQEGTLQEYQKRMKKLDQQYRERIRNAELFLQLETEQVERNYIKEKKAAVKEFEDKKVELKENLIAELEEKKKMIENEKLTMELTGDSMEVKPIMTRKLRRRPNDPVPIPDKRRKPAPAQLNYLLTDEQIMEDLRTLNKLKSPKRPASPSSPEHLPATPAESPAQRFEARIEDGKLYYDKRWYHKSQAIYLESKDNQKLSCVISSVGANEIWVRKTSDSTKMRIYLGQLQRGLFVIRRRKFLTYRD